MITESGIVIDANLVQSMNAEFPIVVTESGIVIVVNPVQPENAP